MENGTVNAMSRKQRNKSTRSDVYGRQRGTPLASALRARRKVLGLTQQELARLAGCGVVFVYAVENGKTTVRLDKLLDVLRVLGLELVLRPGDLRLGEPESPG